MTPRHLVATVLFVDVVASTERALELGNRRWHELLRRYHDVARRAARRFGGRDAGSAGDGLLFTFSQPGEALHAALAIHGAVADLGLQVRAGVHMGEIEGSGRDLGGFALHAGARVTERASPGEVLVSGTVRDALVGSGIEFADRGSHSLKGMPGEWRLYAVTGPLPAAGAPPAAGDRRKWSFRLALAVASVAVLAGVGWWLARDGVAARPPSGSAAVEPRGSGERPRGGASIAAASAVAVLPFAVRGRPEFGYLGEGMVDLLSTKLDGAGSLRSVDPRAVLSLARETRYEGEPAKAEALARSLGADLYVLGSVLEAGGRLQLDVRLYARRQGQRALARSSAEGEADRLFELVDDCIARLLADVAGGPEARVTRLAAVTTHSLPALKEYLRGERGLRLGEFREALDAFGSATALDSTFALAWYKLGIAAEWSAALDEVRRRAAERAVRHGNRLAERDRLLLEAFVVYRRGDHTDAERRYRAILTTYPDDLDAWHQLGETLFHYAPLGGRSISVSRPAWERVLAADPDNLLALTHLARVAAVEGARQEMVVLTDRIERLSPEGDRLAEMLALRAYSGGDAANRNRALEAARAASDQAAFFAVWNVASYAQDLAGALRMADALTDAARSTEARAVGHTLAAYLELGRGRVRAARERLDVASTLDPVLAVEHGALLASLPFVPIEQAELNRLRDELRGLDPAAIPPHVTPSPFFQAHDNVHAVLQRYLLGLLLHRRGETAGAGRLAVEIPALEVPPGQPRVLARNLAMALDAELAAGRRQLEPALAALLSRDPVPYDLQIGSPFYAQGRERYRTGELLTALGRHAEAAAWYGSFREHSVYDVPFRAPADLALGRTYEHLGEPQRAADHYAHVLELWKDCDAELQPLLEEAQRALERLEGAAVAPAPATDRR